ncbi:energy-converting hydrogenase Eha subunit A [Sporosarcina luteola]|nr:energy-converting hydrogenase Eha subunit A [Sporosarcina luteola]
MGGLISTVIGILILFPFIVTLLYLLIVRQTGKASRKSFGQAADVTTPFLFLAVYIVSDSIFGPHAGIYVVVIALVIAIGYSVIERLKVKEFEIMHLLKKIWRLFFLLLVTAYASLLIIGLVLNIISHLK